MRKIILLSLLVFGLLSIVKAQNPVVTTSPGDVDALTENVTITFDVTGTAVEGLTDVYIWAWSNDVKPKNAEMKLCYNGQSANWSDISENAKLAPVEGEANKFKIVLPITVTREEGEVTYKNIAELFGVGETPGKIKEFGFLLRSKDGSKQTPGDMATKVTLVPLVFQESLTRTFPSWFTTNDIVTLYYNQNLATNNQEKIMKDIKISVALLDESETPIVSLLKQNVREERSKEYAYSFLPEKFAEFPDGKSINDVKKVKYQFIGVVKDSNGSDIEVKSGEFIVEFK